MRNFRNHLKIAALGTMFSALLLANAQAQDIDAALERFKELAAEQGFTIDWENAQVAGSDVTLVGVTAGLVDEDPVPIGDIMLTGISENDTGYRIESIEMPYYSVEEGDLTVEIMDVGMTGVLLPKEGQQGPLGEFLFYETANLGSVTTNVAGAEVFSLTDLHVEVTMPEGDAPMEFTGAAEGFAIDLSSVEDPEAKAVIQSLGYERIEGYAEMAGSWQLSSGDLSLSQYDLTVVDAGTLGMSIDLSGYTPEFIEALTRLQQQMAENPEEDSAAQGLAMMGLLQQLSFIGAEISFIDDGLTNKVLAYVADQQGMQPSDIANQAKAIIPFAMAQLNNPDFSAMVTEAVSNFLDDPQSIRITAQPDEAVPFATIMAGAMTTPQNLPETLGVTVVANE